MPVNEFYTLVGTYIDIILSETKHGRLHTFNFESPNNIEDKLERIRTLTFIWCCEERIPMKLQTLIGFLSSYNSTSQVTWDQN